MHLELDNPFGDEMRYEHYRSSHYSHQGPCGGSCSSCRADSIEMRWRTDVISIYDQEYKVRHDGSKYDVNLINFVHWGSRIVTVFLPQTRRSLGDNSE